MVATTLTEDMIHSGRRLVEKLDAAGLSPASAAWVYDTDREAWKLVISDDRVRTDGPTAAYGRLWEALREEADDLAGVPVDAVILSPPDTGTLGLLRSAIRAEGPVASRRLTGNVINGQFIEDAYIYRLN